MQDWIKPAPAKYGGAMLGQQQAATKDATATTTVAPSVTPKLAGLTSPSGPMFWFAALAAGGVALMAYSTYVPVVG